MGLYVCTKGDANASVINPVSVHNHVRQVELGYAILWKDHVQCFGTALSQLDRHYRWHPLEGGTMGDRAHAFLNSAIVALSQIDVLILMSPVHSYV
jgi:hypothetical protein